MEILTCEEINAVAKRGISFRPVEGNTKDAACDTFVSYEEEEDILYLAVFNFSSKETKKIQVDLERIGLDPAGEYEMYDLWSKETVLITDGYEIQLDKAEPKLFRISQSK